MGLARRGRSALVLGALFTVAMLPGCASSNDGSSGSSQSPIRHIVIVVKENHSFDNYFNSLETPPRKLPHCASMTEASDCEYGSSDIPAYYRYASDFGYGNRYFTDIRGPSWPNLMMMIAGQTPLLDDPAAPTTEWTCPNYCYSFPTIGDRLSDAGVTWRNYGTKLYDPFLSIDRYATDTEHNADELRFFDDVSAGMLPSVVWVRPSAPESEHPGYDISQGEQWTVGVVNAIMRSSYWSSTAILLTWDDAGDVVDHVPPPVVEREGSGVPIRYGHRVALIVISPYTPAGTVSQVLLSHVSLLRFIEDVFQVRSLTFRDQTANGLSEFFDFTRAARPPEIL